ncbi:MAG: hypothetical protein KC731_38510 [Myxococcales bacterium]|nr:hypothetical protein [Myxococcales bacterium]
MVRRRLEGTTGVRASRRAAAAPSPGLDPGGEEMGEEMGGDEMGGRAPEGDEAGGDEIGAPELDRGSGGVR